MFIEVTNAESGQEEMININHIVRISINYFNNSETRILLDIEDEYNDRGNTDHLIVKESYEEIRKMMRKTKASSHDIINRFELMELEE